MSQNFSSNINEKLNSDYFRELFNKSELPKKYKSLGKRIKDRQISQRDYDKILSKFMDIYYYELYFINKPSYFFLGGFMEKKRSKSEVKDIGPAKDGQRKKAYIEFPIILQWTGVSFLKYKEKQIKYIKLRGKRTRGNLVEELWKKSNNFYDLKEI